MARRYRGLRAELSSILAIDEFAERTVHHDVPPPNEPISSHLANLITRATEHPDEARTVYAFLPSIMLRIFGFAPGHGWLETCSELSSRDRDALVSIVLPNGPLHNFCHKHTRSRSNKIDVGHDMRFEFATRNLPTLTNKALSSTNPSPSASHSYLASFLVSALRDKSDHMLFLSPLDYFYICLIASPTRKFVNSPAISSSSSKLPKRSRSIPSRRAQYNQVITAYASLRKPSARVDPDDIFIPACLDYFFIPWITATPSTIPYLSTSTADAATSLLLAIAPSSPSDLDLDIDHSAANLQHFETIDLSHFTNAAALYRTIFPMLRILFSEYDASAPIFPLCSYIRALAIFIAPWRHNTRSALSQMLLPKPKVKRNSKSEMSPSMAALSSTLSSINAHLPSPSSSPGNVTAVKESKWRENLRKRQVNADKYLLRSAVVLAANLQLAIAPDGARVLSLLADAAQAARLYSVSLPDEDPDRMEELQLCLDALREQKNQLQRSGGYRERNFIPLLAANLGDKSASAGMLSGISEMVGVGNAKVISALSNGRGSSSRRRLKDLRSNWMGSTSSHDVPFLGSVWDRPVAGNESELLLLFAYWLALRLEPRLGYIPDTRFLGQYWVWIVTALICLVLALTKRMVTALVS